MSDYYNPLDDELLFHLGNATAFYETDNAINFAAKFLCYWFEKPFSCEKPFPTKLPEEERLLLEKEFRGRPPSDPGEHLRSTCLVEVSCCFLHLGIKVFAKLIQQTFTVTGVGPVTARLQSFRWMDKKDDRGMVTVMDYYRMKYGIELK